MSWPKWSILLILIMMGFCVSYTDDGYALYCNSCEDCTNALNDPSRDVVYLTTDISGVGVCINNPENINGKTFDCQGHTISRQEVYEGVIGITISGKNDVTFKNCRLNSFDNAIVLNSSSNIIFENITINDSIRGIVVDNSTHVLINATNMSNWKTRTDLGIAWSRYAPVLIKNSRDVGIKNSVINGYYTGYIELPLKGIEIINTTQIVIDNNTIYNNTRGGIVVDELSSDITITNNRLFDNTVDDHLTYEIDIPKEAVCSGLTMYNNFGDGGRPIAYYTGTANILNEEFCEVIICNGNGINVTNSRINSSGMFIYNTNNIMLNNVTFDGNGILGDSITDMVIDGLKISETQYHAINISNLTDYQIINSRIFGSSGVYLDNSNNGLINNVVFNGSADWVDRGVWLTNSNDVNITNNGFDHISDYGIYIGNCERVVVRNNSINTVSIGIVLNTNDTTVVDNSFRDFGIGIKLCDECYGCREPPGFNIIRNNVIDDGLTGIYIVEGINNQITSNRVCNIRYYGIDSVVSPESNIFSDNTCDVSSPEGLCEYACTLTVRFNPPTTASGNYSQDYIEANVSASNYPVFSNITVYLYNESGFVESRSSSTTQFYTVFSGLEEGTYYLNATVFGLDGSNSSTETRIIRLDNVPPIISHIGHSTSGHSAEISWQTDENSSGWVTYGIYESFLIYSVEDPQNGTTHRVSITGLNRGTTYYFVIHSCDMLGNCKDTDVLNFTTLNPTYDVYFLDVENQTTGVDDIATYEVNIFNNGEATDSYTLYLENIDHADVAVLSNDHVLDVPPGETATVELNVSASYPGDYTVQLTVVSDSDFHANDTINITTTVNSDYYVDNGTAFICYSCEGCTAALNDSRHDVVYVGGPLEVYYPLDVCIAISNISNKVFDCQGNPIFFSYTSFVNMEDISNITIRNCIINQTDYDSGHIILTNGTNIRLENMVFIYGLDNFNFDRIRNSSLINITTIESTESIGPNNENILIKDSTFKNSSGITLSGRNIMFYNNTINTSTVSLKELSNSSIYNNVFVGSEVKLLFHLSNDTIDSNIFYNPEIGIGKGWSVYNLNNIRITNNRFINSIKWDIFPYEYECDEYTIENNTGSGGLPIKFYKEGGTVIRDEELSELILCSGENYVVENVNVHGSGGNNGIIAIDVENSVFNNVNSSGNYYGIIFEGREYRNMNNTITNSYFDNNNQSGILTSNTSMKFLIDSCYIRNNTFGINLSGSRHTDFHHVIRNSIIEGNTVGVSARAERVDIISNSVSFNSRGVEAYDGGSLINVSNNIIEGNREIGFVPYGHFEELILQNNHFIDNYNYDIYPFCTWTADNYHIENNLGGDKPIIFLANEDSIVLRDIDAAEVILRNVNNAILENVRIIDSDGHPSNGMMVWNSENVSLNNILLDSTYAGLTIGSRFVDVTNSIFTNTWESGLTIMGESSNITLRNITSTNNNLRYLNDSDYWLGGGILFWGGAVGGPSNITAENLKVSHNHPHGIATRERNSNIVIKNSTITYNDEDGFRITGSLTGLDISNSTICHNGEYGIISLDDRYGRLPCDSSKYNIRVINNDVWWNKYGIYYACTFNSEITENEIFNNSEYGVKVSFSSDYIGVYNNVIQNNSVGLICREIPTEPVFNEIIFRNNNICYNYVSDTNISLVYSSATYENNTCDNEIPFCESFCTARLVPYFVEPTPENGNYSQDYIPVNVTLMGHGLESVTVYLYNSTGLVESSTGSAVPYFVNFTGLHDGTYYINASVRNTSGAEFYTETRVITLDNTPPVISNIQVSNVTGDRATVSWETNEPATSHIEYWFNETLGRRTVDYIALETSHEFTLTYLNGNTTYYYQITSCDGVGNCNTTTIENFTTEEWMRNFSLIIPDNQTVLTRMHAIYRFTLTNTGNIRDTYLYSITNLDGADYVHGYFSPTRVNYTQLGPDNSVEFVLDMWNPTPGNYTVKIIIYSASQPSVNKTVYVKTEFVGGEYLDNGTAFICYSCEGCTAALNNNTRSLVVLNRNIVDVSDVCINDPENMSNKIFDCEGHEIVGVGTEDSAAVFVNGKENVTLRNCVIRGFDHGILVNNSILMNILNNTLRENSYGIYGYGLNESRIDSNRISYNDMSGVHLNNSHENILTNNSVCYNDRVAEGYYDVYVNGSDNSFYNNTCDTSNSPGVCSYMCAPSGPITIRMVGILPYIVEEGENVSLYIYATNAYTVYANITQPDGTVDNLLLTNGGMTVYTNTSQFGRYNVSFHAARGEEDVSVDDYFEVSPSASFKVMVFNSEDEGINVSVIAYYRDEEVKNFSAEDGNITDTIVNSTLDLRFIAYDGKFEVLLRNVNMSTNYNRTLGLDRSTMTHGYLVMYGINNTYLFDNATLKLYYGDVPFTREYDLHLFKCDDYDFFSRECEGTWRDITSNATQNISGDYFVVNVSSFSGFGIKQVSTSGGGGSGSGGSGGTGGYESWGGEPSEHEEVSEESEEEPYEVPYEGRQVSNESTEEQGNITTGEQNRTNQTITPSEQETTQQREGAGAIEVQPTPANESRPVFQNISEPQPTSTQPRECYSVFGVCWYVLLLPVILIIIVVAVIIKKRNETEDEFQ